MSHPSRYSALFVALVGLALSSVLAFPVSAMGKAPLPPGAPNTVSGVVRDDGGTPVADVVVTSWRWEQSTESWQNMPDVAFSAEDGSYTLEGLEAGTYRVAFIDIQNVYGSFYAPGFNFTHTPQFYNNHNTVPALFLMQVLGGILPNNVDSVVISDGVAGPVGIDASLTLEPASISGQVRDEAGAPIGEGVVAVLYGHDELASETWAELCSVPVEADGTYAFRGLYGGMYRVGFWSDGGQAWTTQYYPAKASFGSAESIECGPILRSGIDATLTPASLSATGSVVDRATGAPLSGMQVSASYAESNTDFAVSAAGASTGADGGFELKGLAPGHDYEIHVIDPARRHSSAAAAVSYNGTVIGGLDFELRPVPAIKEFGDYDSDESASAQLVYEQFKGDFTDVTDIVVIPDDTRDPQQAVSAPGLCWAYQITTPGSPNLGTNAPLLTVPWSDEMPDLETLVAEIAEGNATADRRVAIHVVGTKRTVPAAQVERLRSSITSAGGTATIDWLVSDANADRYDVAIAVAKRIKDRASISATDALTPPRYVLIGNGVDYRTVTSPVAFSAVSAATGSPVLLVGRHTVPLRVKRALRALGISGSNTYIAGGSNVISKRVRLALGVPKANRLAGPVSRPTVAGMYAAVSRKAAAKGWLDVSKPLAVAYYPDELLVAGAAAGNAGGAVLTVGRDLAKDVRQWLDAHSAQMTELWLVGDITSEAGAYYEYLGTYPIGSEYEEDSDASLPAVFRRFQEPGLRYQEQRPRE